MSEMYGWIAFFFFNFQFPYNTHTYLKAPYR